MILDEDKNLTTTLARRGISRRAFLKFCAVVTGTLALPNTYIPRVA